MNPRQSNSKQYQDESIFGEVNQSEISMILPFLQEAE